MARSVLPACLQLLRDLSSLAIGSVIGNLGTLYTMLFMCLRWLDGSYITGGKYATAIAAFARPKFTPISATRPLLNPAIFVLISMLASAFLAHYNAPKFYKELQAPADGSSKAPVFNLVCAIGFGGAALLMGTVMAAGFLTFGQASQVKLCQVRVLGKGLRLDSQMACSPHVTRRGSS